MGYNLQYDFLASLPLALRKLDSAQVSLSTDAGMRLRRLRGADAPRTKTNKLVKRSSVSRVFTIPILTRGIVTIWRSEYTRNRNTNFRFYSKMESFGTESLKNIFFHYNKY